MLGHANSAPLKPQRDEANMKLLIWSVIAGSGAVGAWMWITGGC